jgi:hypothetical protein
MKPWWDDCDLDEDGAVGSFANVAMSDRARLLGVEAPPAASRESLMVWTACGAPAVRSVKGRPPRAPGVSEGPTSFPRARGRNIRMGARPYPSEGSRMRASVRGVGRAAQGSGGRQKDPLVPARLGGEICDDNPPNPAERRACVHAVVRAPPVQRLPTHVVLASCLLDAACAGEDVVDVPLGVVVRP